jgi:hypothetical protein
MRLFMSEDNSQQQMECGITRREVNKALVSAGLTLLTSSALGSALRGSSEAPKSEIESPAARLLHERSWNVGSSDNSTHVLGNGQAMVHELGPNIVYFRAPWISSPNLLTMELVVPANIRTVSSREQGTSVWHHKIYSDSQEVGVIIDFLEEATPVLRRVVRCSIQLTFSVKSPRLVDYSQRYDAYGALLGQWPYGTTIYGDFKSSDPFTIQLLFCKLARVQSINNDTQSGCRVGVATSKFSHETLIHVPAGNSEVFIAAGSSVQNCFESTDLALKTGTQEALLRTRRYWGTRLSNVSWPGQDRDSSLQVATVVDDIATLLLGHQSKAGSVVAGQAYPLFYVRDQYGVSRALLAMNMKAEARAILAYFYSVFRQYGKIRNAQSDGPRHWFHRAENDDVELTGYLIIQAFDYLQATGDAEFVTEILPMLEWALNAQEGQLFSGMLSFNGDETYVAGGVFPRNHLNDGSSEATLLYLASADRMLSWLAARKLWPMEKIHQHQESAANVRANYAGNFIVGGKITVNHPRDPRPGILPRFRYGVCLGHYDDNCLFLSDTEIAEDGRYFCYSCYPQRTRQTYELKNHFIPSVGLTSFLAGYSAVSSETMRVTTMDAVAAFTKSGAFAWPDKVLPGYETAVVSLALSRQSSDRAPEFIQKMLSLRDATGAWAEYYVGAEPKGCRCRPWESGLSLLALLDHVSKL